VGFCDGENDRETNVVMGKLVVGYTQGAFEFFKLVLQVVNRLLTRI